MAFDAVGSEDGRARALAAIDRLVETDNSRRTNTSLWATWCDLNQAWGDAPLPLTAAKVRQVAAMSQVDI